MRVRSFAILLLGLSAIPSQAKASAADPWFGKDKTLHFGVSAALAAGGYGAGALIWEGTTERLISGATISLTAGAAKELADLAGLGDPSWRDFAWDVIGTGAGLALAYTLDRFVFRRSDETVVMAPGGLALRW